MSSTILVNPFIQFPTGGGSPITLIAHAEATSGASGNASLTSAIDTTGATLLVVSVGYVGGAGDPVVTDSESNTWAALTERSGGTGRQKLYYVKNPTVDAAHTFTVVLSGSFHSTAVAAFTLTDTTTNADGENGAGSASATTIQPGSLTPSVNNCLVVCGLTYFDGAGGDATINSGFTITDTLADATSFAVGLAYKVQTTAGAENPTWTSPAGAERMIAAIAAFKHA